MERFCFSFSKIFSGHLHFINCKCGQRSDLPISGVLKSISDIICNIYTHFSKFWLWFKQISLDLNGAISPYVFKYRKSERTQFWQRVTQGTFVKHYFHRQAFLRRLFFFSLLFATPESFMELYIKHNCHEVWIQLVFRVVECGKVSVVHYGGHISHISPYIAPVSPINEYKQ